MKCADIACDDFYWLIVAHCQLEHYECWKPVATNINENLIPVNTCRYLSLLSRYL